MEIESEGCRENLEGEREKKRQNERSILANLFDLVSLASAQRVCPSFFDSIYDENQ